MKRFLPVVHITDEAQALEQVAVARGARADGVWLIDHANTSAELLAVYRKVRAEHPDFWIGLNFLDETAVGAAVAVPIEADGLWTDDAGAQDIGPKHWVFTVKGVLKNRGWKGEYFGGVAFKGQHHVTSQDQIKGSWMAAKVALDWVDVVTTSGAATGVAAGMEKIRAMREVVPGRLAVASGITVPNVGDYLPYVDDFLVATGISRDFHHLDPDKTAELAGIIHEFDKPVGGPGLPTAGASEPPGGPEGV